MAFHPDSIPDLKGRVYIVTGGTSGMYVLHSSRHERTFADRYHLVDITQYYI